MFNVNTCVYENPKKLVLLYSLCSTTSSIMVSLESQRLSISFTQSETNFSLKGIVEHHVDYETQGVWTPEDF